MSFIYFLNGKLICKKENYTSSLNIDRHDVMAKKKETDRQTDSQKKEKKEKDRKKGHSIGKEKKQPF